MSTDTKAMEEALQVAVAQMAKPGAGANGGANPLALLMTVLPKLLASNEEREDLVERLEGLEKDTFTPLQEQIQGLRKQVHRVGKLQQEIIEELRELREQQTLVGNAVLHLAEQMTRVGIVDEDMADEFDELPDERELYRDLASPSATKLGRTRSPGGPTQANKKRLRPR